MVESIQVSMAKTTDPPTPPPRHLRQLPAKRGAILASAIPRPITAGAVRDLLAATLGDLHAGQIDGTRARALSTCATALLRAIETADLEARIRRLEAVAEERS